jgi:hypothetical protein
MRRETMKTIFLTAVAALSLGLNSAYAAATERDANLRDDNVIRGIEPNTPPTVATPQNGQAVHVFVSQSDHGTWLYQGQGHQGANS